ncbi:3-hydroxyacyl-CoA dehydrogenase NAD-binding domain-containing protein [Streptomyces lunaelactis]|nr:3-hydroxyacyl-CoA dehydrogenase NAD-binding domain-containing protein [Streptomyces lunaelactis]
MTTKATGIQRVGVVGGGQMGAGIAEVFARVELNHTERHLDPARR